MSDQCVYAIDIGGTKIAAGLIPADDPARVIGRSQRPTNAAGGRDAVLAALSDALDALDQFAAEAGLVPVAVGVGSPGVVDTDRAVVDSCGQTMPGWSGMDLGAFVGGRTGLPVAAVNDVRAFGLGESNHGAGRGYHRVVCVALGTGLGGAIIIDGRLSPTPHYCLGEIPYLFAPTPDGGCDIVENVGAGPGLAATYRRWAGIVDPSWDLRRVMERYREGEQLAWRCIDESMRCTGQALAGFINGVDADAVILGGGVVSIGQPISAPLIAGIRSHLIPGLDAITIAVAELGTDAQLVGAGVAARSVAAQRR